MLAVVTVDTHLDVFDYNDGVTSLREAIFATNLVEGADEILFDFGHDGLETILLTQGELLISDSLTINGPGATILFIDASGNDPTPDLNVGDGSRIFNIDDSNAATNLNIMIGGLTLTGGDTSYEGGAIYSNENLLVADSVIVDNHAVDDGGGIHAEEKLILMSTTITSNSSRDNGGAIRSQIFGQIIASTISNNRAERGGGIDSRAMLMLNNTEVSGNFAEIGGGINTRASSTTTITRSSIFGNASDTAGGGIRVDGSTTIIESTFSGNTAGTSGGGIRARNSVDISQSTISGNFANYGGGIHATVDDGVLTSIRHSTITDNYANTYGGGIRVLRESIEGSIEVDSSIVAGNDARSDGKDIFGTAYLGFTTQVGFGSEFLGPLADNGGATLTHALLYGSPALDAGDASFTSPPNYDQRGAPYSRVVGSHIDVGAYEAQYLPLEADLNADGFIDASDFGILSNNFGMTGKGYAQGNLNDDPYVDAADIGILFSNWTSDVESASFNYVSELKDSTAELSSAYWLNNRRVEQIEKEIAMEEMYLYSPRFEQSSLRQASLPLSIDDPGDLRLINRRNSDSAEIDSVFSSWVEDEEHFFEVGT